MANALSSNSESGAFRFVRAGSTGFSVLFLIVFFWATWILYTKPLAIDFLSYFGEALRRLSPLISDGLVSVVGSFISVTPRGRLLLRSVATCFDRYFGAPTVN